MHMKYMVLFSACACMVSTTRVARNSAWTITPRKGGLLTSFDVILGIANVNVVLALRDGKDYDSSALHNIAQFVTCYLRS